MNQVNCVGNITKDALLKQGNYGPFLTFTLAVNVGYGEKQSTIWYSCMLTGKRSEKLAHLFKKGRPICLSAEFNESEYTAKDGSKKTSKNLQIDRFKFLDKSPPKNNDNVGDNYGNQYSKKEELPMNNTDFDDIPF